ncbi:DUF2306 domain-containing protein [Actinomadura fibrosa]|uniref:DUF2306 domain-containing protein n=1 Tax=Actinomadura fibrosa TaxID=111802 RepID=A0ABW2Y2A1_9ACTN|nr:DUF2306 domain-containing protein [Actinomadura fibrosa]
MAVVVLWVLWFLAYTLPKYVPRLFDPQIAAVRSLHGGAGILALVGAVPQMWPGLRDRHPAFHRWNGRVYVFGGVLPGSLMLFGTLFAIGRPDTTASFFWGVVWLSTTAAAWRAIRRRRYAEHRRWMAYSVAITLVAATNAGLVVASPRLTWLVSTPVLLDTLDWLPWVLHLLIAHWLVTRRPAAPRPAGRRRVSRSPRRR